MTSNNVYGIMTIMIRNNNNKENEMKHTHEIVASRIPSGLTNELQIICKIGIILKEMGKSPTQVNYLMTSNPFITDVLSAYKGI